jgi:DNA-directed RNA polymerase subunit H
VLGLNPRPSQQARYPVRDRTLPVPPEVAIKHLVKKAKEEKEPSYDVFQHELVPKHILLKPEEIKKVLAEYHIQPYQLPYIKDSDPAARAVKAKPGDIIKVIRRSQTAGESDFYRYVVEEF